MLRYFAFAGFLLLAGCGSVSTSADGGSGGCAGEGEGGSGGGTAGSAGEGGEGGSGGGTGGEGEGGSGGSTCGGVTLIKGCATPDACCDMTPESLAAHCDVATESKYPVPYLCLNEAKTGCVTIGLTHLACSWVTDAQLYCCTN